jgi:glycosyltransferase involved in cell wall biosynthesis
MSMPRYSIVIPVFDRPQELEELLVSLTQQSTQDFEVLVVDDGSKQKSDGVLERFANVLKLKYFYKPNGGPGPSRNYGFERAAGDYFVVFDSDCVLPPHYFEAVEKALSPGKIDMWGGPDRGRGDFTPLQQAMGYTMSSLLTTGGIRGGKDRAFQPRSFNMGMSRKVYEATGGFRLDRFAEDIELSIRVSKMGFTVTLIRDAFVYHKRRTTLGAFFTQVSNFGKGRVMVGMVHPGAVKLTHWFPSVFLIGLFLLPFLLLVNTFLGSALVFIYMAYMMAIYFDTAFKSRSFPVALLAIPCAFIQMTGYGFGFLKAFLTRTQ